MLFPFFLVIVGVLIYTEGFFNVNINPFSSQASATNPSNNSDLVSHSLNPPDPRFGRVVLLIIDALRADLIFGKIKGDLNNNANDDHDPNVNMPFISSIINQGDAVPLVSIAHIPTVTMPRLKALTAGVVPQFIDVLKNVDTSGEGFASDNFISKMVETKKRIVHYGDPTWNILFPDAFVRSDPTVSFFAKDTVEVDVNVTRHLSAELDPFYKHPKSQDWDVLILHYLGLDHVGHSLGPSHPRMNEKLKEMDDVIKYTLDSIKSQDKLRESELPTLFVLISDHGMTESGNHGGSTTMETHSVLLFVGNGLEFEKGNSGKNDNKSYPSVLQVDLVPSLCMLLGLPIPRESIGILIPHLGFGDYEYDILAAHFKCNDQSEKHKCINSKVEEALNSLGSDVNALKCLLAIFLSFIAVFLTFGSLINKQNIVNISTSLVFTLIHGGSLLSSSFVENEHATTFYLTSSILLFFIIKNILQPKDHPNIYLFDSKIEFSMNSLLLIIIVILRVIRTRNIIINFGRLNNLPGASDADTESVIPSLYGWMSNYILFFMILLAVMHCTTAVNRFNFMSYANMFGYVMLFVSKCYVGDTILFSRLSIFSVIILLSSFKPKWITSGMLILFLLLHRNGNTLAIIILYLASFLVSKVFLLQNKEYCVMILYWIGRCGFFGLGNSHAMATIDISGAYTGLSEYNATVVQFFTFLIVHSGQIIAFLPLLLGKNESDLKYIRDRLKLEFSLSYFRSAFILFLMKNHLFIWSVFAPRYCYDTISTIGFLFLLLFF